MTKLYFIIRKSTSIHLSSVIILLCLIINPGTAHGATNTAMLPGTEPDTLIQPNIQTLNPWPTDWEVPVNTGNFAYAKIEATANPRINGVPIEAGDWIGVFYTDVQGVQHCAGAGEWDPAGLLFGFFGDDPYTPYKDGFSYNEVIKFKIFDYSKNKAYDVTNVQYGTCQGCNTSGKFNGLGIHKVTNMYLNFVLDVVASAVPSSHCLSGTSQLNATVTGANGLVTYSWTSTPAGFTSNVPNPVVSLTQTTRYNITINNGNNTSSHYVKVSIFNAPAVEAGDDGTICSNKTFTTTGDVASNYSSLLWTTSGDGTFSNNGALHTVYTPGPTDKVTPAIKLFLTAFANNPCQGSVTDSTTLNIVPLANVFAGDDFWACTDNPVQLNATATGFSSVLWTRSGGGTPGSFNDPTVLNPVYSPSTYDLVIGYVNLVVTVQPVTPCTAPATDIIKVSFRKAPTCNPGTGGTICATTTFNVSGNANNQNSVLWTSSGDGTFINPAALTTTYIPGENDRTGGTVSLSLNAFPYSPCTNPATGSINLVIRPLPVVNAGEDQYFSSFDSIPLSGTVTNFSSFAWTENGDGNIKPLNSLTPYYFPAGDDMSKDTITVRLIGYSISPCTLPVVDTVSLVKYFQNNFTAGVDDTLCAPVSYTFSAQADNSLRVGWTTSGTGYFSNDSVINPTYHFSPADINTGYVDFTLTAEFSNPAILFSDQVRIIIRKLPVANAGADINFCSLSPVQLNGSASDFSSVFWVTSGTGNISQNLSLNAVYYPSVSDTAQADIQLYLFAYPVNPCQVAVVDTLKLIRRYFPAVDAGSDRQNCDVSPVLLSGTVSQYASVYWQTTGNGTFENITSLMPVYHPSPDDIEAGSVTITMEVQFTSPCLGDMSDELTVTFHRKPVANAGTDLSFCRNNSVSLTGTAQNYSGIQWLTTGDGTFSNSQGLNTEYIPGANDQLSQAVLILLQVNPVSPCTIPAIDSLNVIRQTEPEIYAGIDQMVCEYSTVTVYAEGSFFSGVNWSSSGDGFFSNPSLLSTTYHPAGTDYMNGPVSLTVTAYPVSPCTIPVSDLMVVNFTHKPSAHAGPDQSVCGTSPVPLQGEADYFSAVSWSTSGTGYFTHPDSLHTIYHPSVTDINTGNITITLSASPQTPCTQNVTDLLVLTLVKEPVVFAGQDAPVCEGSSFFITTSSASGYSSLLWTTSGTGTYNNTGILNPVYSPSTADIQSGFVTLTLTAYPQAPCITPKTSGFILGFVKSPSVSAGTDQSVCGSSPVQLNADASHYSSLLWTTGGTGYFTQVNTLNPVYYPGQQDVNSGSVILTLTANPNAPCNTSAISSVSITFSNPPLTFAGADKAICAGSSAALSDAEVQYYSSVLWTTSGTGTFADSSDVNTSYTPSIHDRNLGSVTLTLTANPVNPCTVASSDQLTLTIVKNPEADAGYDQSVCGSGPVYLQGSADHYSSVEWKSNGTGTFTSISELNTTYYPSIQDLNKGSIQVTLFAYAISPCFVTDYDIAVIYLTKSPMANAGSDKSLCVGQNIVLEGFTNYSSYEAWSSTGDGQFEDPSSAVTIYTPGTLDIANGYVFLVLCAGPQAPCATEVCDSVRLTITENPQVSAGGDIAACGINPVPVAGSGSFFYEVTWTSSGNGTFSDPADLVTQYNPSEDDIEMGQLQLTLTASPVSPCITPAVDFLILTLTPGSVIDAGDDQVICDDDVVVLNPAATSYEGILWLTSGDGHFQDSTQLNTVYFPGELDITAGLVYLTILVTPIAPCELIQTDEMNVTIVHNPFVNAGENQTVCEGKYAQLEASAGNYETIVWTTDGDGYFSDSSSLITYYFPGDQDIVEDSVQLVLTAVSGDPCNSVVKDTMWVIITGKPSANAGDDLLSCDNEPVELYGIANNLSAVRWLSNGDGQFSNPQALNTIYYPGSDDILNGLTQLVLRVFPVSPCDLPVEDQIELTVRQKPMADAGTDKIFCGDDPVQLNGVAHHFQSITWSTEGDGTFNAPGQLTTEYFPGISDSQSGSVKLILTAMPQSPCTSPFVDTLLLIRQPEAVAVAGEDQTVCFSDAVQLSGSVENADGFYWQSSGDGEFNNPGILNPVYTPGQQDLTNLNFQLTLVATNTLPCNGTTEDLVNISILPETQADAGSDMLFYKNKPVYLSGFASANNGIQWHTSGDGEFSEPHSLNTSYIHGNEDLSNGSVLITLYVTGMEPCPEIVSDELTLTLTDCLTLSVQPEALICIDQPFQATAGSTGYSSVLWTTRGDGVFSDPYSLESLYTPGVLDKENLSALLTVTVFSNEVCIDTLSSDILLNIQEVPGIQTLSEVPFCIGSDVLLSAEIFRYSSFAWSTTGDGSFSDPSSANTVYEPGETDIEAGSVELLLTVHPLSPCTDSTVVVVTLTGTEPVTVSAGADGSVCEGFAYPLNGSASGYDSLTWSTDGSGEFDDIHSLTAIYNPSPADADLGDVQLTLTAFSSGVCSGEVSESMILTINPLPEIETELTLATCGNTPIVPEPVVTDYESVLWTSTGSGIFSDPFSVVTEYTPSDDDVAQGNVVLTLTALNACGETSENIELSFIGSMAGSAGDDLYLCDLEPLYLDQPWFENYDGIIWYTYDGTGMMINDTAVNPLYLPSFLDMIVGEVHLVVVVSAAHPCEGAIQDTVLLSFPVLPEVHAGDGGLRCLENGVIVLNESTASGYESLVWSSQGDGEFSDISALHPEYTPGTNDMTSGSVTLELTVTGFCGTDSSLVIYDLLEGVNAEAGPDQVICTGSEIPLAGYSENYDSVLWTTVGSGTFDDADSLSTNYHPSSADHTNGSVWLRLTVYPLAPCTESITDSLLVTITGSPEVNITGSDSVCVTSLVELQAITGNVSSVLWRSSGDGSFTDATSATTYYQPGAEDTANRQVTLFLDGMPVSPCEGLITAEHHVFFAGLPYGDAGADQTVCAGSDVIIHATARDYSHIYWTRPGDGTFNVWDELSVVYTPGPADLEAGSVTLMLHAEPLAECTTAGFIDELYVTFQQAPTVNAGDDITDPGIAPVSLSGTAAHYSSLLWLSSGDGTFDDSTSATAHYIAGQADVQKGYVTLKLRAYAISPCEGFSEDSLVISFVNNLWIIMPDDGIVCEGDGIVITATGGGYSSVSWWSDGDGSIIYGDNELEISYLPGSYDVEKGDVMLRISATAIAPYTGTVEDSLLLTITGLPEVITPTGVPFCKGSDVPLSAEIFHYSSFAWSTTGDGSFSDPFSASTVYEPGDTDIETGDVELLLTVHPLSPCTDSTVVVVSLTGTEPVTVSAGVDGSVCEGIAYPLSGSASGYDSLIWSTDGSGEFDDIHLLTAMYTPSSADIESGEVLLTLTAISNGVCSGEVSESMVLTITSLPSVTLPAVINSCSLSPVLLSPEASGYTAAVWTSTGTGLFGDTLSVSTVYYPSTEDTLAGEVTLMLTLFSDCENLSAVVDIAFHSQAEGTAGQDFSSCGGAVISLDDAYFNNFESLLWNTFDGTGSLDDSATMNPSYSPSLQDLIRGYVHFVVTVQGMEGCDQTLTDTVEVSILKLPDAFAGDDEVKCVENGMITMEDAWATGYENLLWQTYGDGTFVDSSALIPQYIPGENDVEFGGGILVLTASNLCGSVVDSVYFSFVYEPEVDAGSDREVCENSVVPLNPSVFYHASLIWSTSGTGYFENPDSLITAYIPSEQDDGNGEVILMLTAFPMAPCTMPVTDSLQVVIFSLPQASITGTSQICENDLLELTANAENISSLTWRTSGNGFFTEPNGMTTLYQPGSEEIGTGQVTIYLDYEAADPCSGVQTSAMLVNIYQLPDGSAGEDLTVCEGEPVFLNLPVFENYQDIQWYTYDGTGFFENETVERPTYYPSFFDFMLGQIHLVVLASGVAPCVSPLADTVVLSFISPGDFIIESDISDISAIPGQPVYFYFRVNGPLELTYQWFGPSGLIENATDSILVLESVSFADGGEYYCQATYMCGIIESNHAILSLGFKQVISIPAGWSGISTSLIPWYPALETVFAGKQELIDIMQDDNSHIYWPAQNINTIVNWQSQEGYSIKMLEPAELVLYGPAYADPAIWVNPGWNMIPVNCTSPVDVELFANQSEAVKIIKEIAGAKIYWPEFNVNTLGYLEPGKSYLLLNSDSQILQLSFNCSATQNLKNIQSESMNTSPWSDPLCTPGSHVIIIPVSLFGNLTDGDVLGAFTSDGVCAGLTVLSPYTEFGSISLFPDDPLTLIKDGFVEGEPITWKYYDTETGSVSTVRFDYDFVLPDNSGLFQINGLSKITRTQVLVINDDNSVDHTVRVYPNPSQGIFYFEGLSLSESQVKIFNQVSQLVFTGRITGEISEVDLTLQGKGVYTVLITQNSTVLVKRIVIR